MGVCCFSSNPAHRAVFFPPLPVEPFLGHAPGRMIDPKVFTALLLTSMGAAGTALGAFMVVLHPKASGSNNRSQGGSTSTIARLPSSPCPP